MIFSRAKIVLTVFLTHIVLIVLKTNICLITENELLKDSDIIYDHPRMRNQSSVNVSDSFKSRLLHMSPAPNCSGARWSYTDAIAKSVDELNSVILSGLKKQSIDPKNKDLFIKVTVKEGAD